jgi:hypothetical protein
LSEHGFSGPNGATVALDANGDVVFTPNANFNGAACFSYQVRDPSGALSPGVTAVIPVAPVNDNPVAADDQFSTYAGSQMLIQASQLLGNDSDADGDALAVGGAANAQHGTVSYANGVVQFNPDVGYVGQASFQYETTDGQGGSAWGTAYVDVLQPNLAPTLTQAWILSAAAYDLSPFVRYVYSVELDMASPTGALLSYQVIGADGSPSAMQTSNHFIENYWLEQSMTDPAPPLLPFTVRVTDQDGNWTDVAIGGEAAPLTGDFLPASVLSTHVAPIVLDLDGDGAQFDQIAQSAVHFDLNGDGKQEHLAWASRHDGTLVFDANGDHVVNGPQEFAFTQYKAGAQTDLEGLRAFDTNHNGKLDAGDVDWKRFGVWQDADGDGVSTAKEFKTLDQLGIASIALQSDAQLHRVGSDVTVMGQTTVTHTDGSTSMAADASLMALAEPPAPPAPTVCGFTQAELMQQALVFAQWSAVPLVQTEPLGFVPSSAYSMTEDASLFDQLIAQHHSAVREPAPSVA